VLVRGEAAGLNLMDTYIRRGLHAGAFTQAPPLSLGVDGRVW